MKGHKWFAAVYDRMMAPNEKRFLGDIRRDMLAGLSGDVLEIGAGTGANFGYYPAAVRVSAVEPDPYMLQRARERAKETQRDIDLQQASAEDLPFPDASFDTAISTLVLCSVEDPALALSEVFRVLRPGGELHLFEHVRYDHALGAVAQDVIAPLWRWFGAGCNPNRHTGRFIEEAGFQLTDWTLRKDGPPLPPFVFTRPHLQATARKPA